MPTIHHLHADARDLTQPANERAALRKRVFDLVRGKAKKAARSPRPLPSPTPSATATPKELPQVTAESISPRQLRRLGPRLALARFNRNRRGPQEPIRLARVAATEPTPPSPEVLDALGVLIAASDGGRVLGDAEVIERAKAIWTTIQGVEDEGGGGGAAPADATDLDDLFRVAVAMKKKGLGVEYPAPPDPAVAEEAAKAMKRAGFRRDPSPKGLERWVPMGR
ncbi:hypothetical protein [Limnoglobus roseus]|uniref:Uncharacterized protein n=1 Tax=Limnoglobus roseus TaxID=2598579 RepID=A0A5C1AJ65_9BACT|nr:hypothetical protein [Limnoglobus roseus]QEL17164.1 hypothetical protein PX52LOC_04146 [Limnoglobus roseus]